MKNTIVVTITEYEASKTIVADEHPIANDKNYVDVVKTKATLHYTYSGVKCNIKGENKEELILKMKERVIFDTFMEAHEAEDFNDVGLESPEVNGEKVHSLFDYVYSCRKLDRENYKKVLRSIQEVAENEYAVEVVE